VRQLLKLNGLNVGSPVTIHGLALRIIWMSVKAKLLALALSDAMQAGSWSTMTASPACCCASPRTRGASLVIAVGLTRTAEERR